MSNKAEIAVIADGTILRRLITEEPISINQNALESLAGALQIPIKNLFSVNTEELGTLAINASVKRGKFLVSTKVPKINLRAPFKVFAATTRTNVLTPNFSSPTDPVLELVWTPPEDMNLQLVINMVRDDDQWKAAKTWLVAYRVRKAYALPLANLYDDATLCTGDFNSFGKTMDDTIKKCVTQMWRSNWNGDLFSSSKAVQCENLFRFKPDTFEMVSPRRGWTNDCEPIATAITNEVVL